MRVRFVFCVLVLGFISLANAGKASWGQTNKSAVAAINAGNIEQALELFDRALATAQTEPQKVETHFGLAIANFRLENWQQMIVHADALLALPIIDTPAELDRKIYLLGLKQRSFGKLGQFEQMLQVESLVKVLEAKKPRPAWSSTKDGTNIHKFSGFRCPQAIGELQLTTIKVYNRFGSDTSCGYNMPDTGSVTIYMSQIKGNATEQIEGIAAKTIAQINEIYGNPKWLVQGQRNILVNNKQILLWEAITNDAQRQGRVLSTGVWQAAFANWIFKIRISWDDPLQTDLLRQKIVPKLLAKTVQDLWVDRCFFNSQEQEEVAKQLKNHADISGEVMNALVGVTIMVRGEFSKESEDIAGFLQLLPQAQGAGCLLGATGNAANPYVNWRTLGTGLVGHFSSKLPVDSTTEFVFSMRTGLDSSITQHGLFVQKGDKTYLLKLFENRLSDKQFSKEVQETVLGNFSYLGYFDNKNGAINITTPDVSKN